MTAPSLEARVAADASTPHRELELEISGMHCASCVHRVQRLLTRQEGVEEALVDLARERALVRFDPAVQTVETLLAAIARGGYEARERQIPEDEDPLLLQERRAQTRARVEARRAWTALGLALPLGILAMGPMLVPAWHAAWHGTRAQQVSEFVMWLLDVAIVLGPARELVGAGLRKLVRWAPDMDALITLGTGTALLHASAVVLVPGSLPPGATEASFETPGWVLAMVLLGRMLEGRARHRATQAVQVLERGHLERVRRPVPGRPEETERVPATWIAAGDAIRLERGDRAGVDARITAERGWVDDAWLTGESTPREVGPGELVRAGTRILEGSLPAVAERPASESSLARIAGLVEEALRVRPPVQRLADGIVARFVPVVLLIALASALAWGLSGRPQALSLALGHAIAVLVVACPCALGLATPLAVMVGTGRAAAEGICFRDAEALETLARVDHVAFDKTGTLTRGAPRLVAWTEPEAALTEHERTAIWLVASASQHPLSRAVAAHLPADPPDPGGLEELESFPGRGVQARVGGRSVQVGSLGWLLPENRPAPTAGPGEGQQGVWVALDGRIRAIATFEDPLRDGADTLVTWLEKSGIEVSMVTGDRPEGAREVARGLGISRVRSGCLPADKVAWVRDLQAQGRRVAFVGDGVNDGPVLAAADVGLGLASGSDLARAAGRVTLVSDAPVAVSRAIGWARATHRNIRFNLAWASLYNVLLIPVAAGGLEAFGGPGLPPAWGGAAMALSSLTVAWSASRLRRRD
jgi:Cu+-exporting ATPase